MTGKVDEARATQDDEQDETSAQTSGETKATSQSNPATQEKAKDEVKRISDQKAEEGRQLKSLKEQLDKLTAELQKERDEKFAIAAEREGRSVEELKEKGINTVEELQKAKEYASLFGAAQKEYQKPTFKPDSGKGGGVGKIPWAEFASMDDKGIKELIKKHGVERPDQLVEMGVVSMPK